jgi:hypothetical protein
MEVVCDELIGPRVGANCVNLIRLVNPRRFRHKAAIRGKVAGINATSHANRNLAPVAIILAPIRVAPARIQRLQIAVAVTQKYLPGSARLFIERKRIVFVIDLATRSRVAQKRSVRPTTPAMFDASRR